MSGIMLRQALRDQRRTTLWFALGAAVYVLAIVAFYPSIRGSSQQFEDLLNAYPEAIREAFGIADFSSFAGFVGAEALNVIWPLVAAGFAIVVGNATVAGEIERGSVDLWLSVPVTRWRLLLAKVVAALLGLLAIVVATVVALAAGAVAIGEWPGIGPLAAVLVTLPAIVVTVLGYSVLLSALLGSRGAAAGLAAAVTLLSYLFWIIANMSDQFEWLRYLSIFSAYDAQAALADAIIRWRGLGALILVGAACTLMALAIFERRDAIA
jgi:ABC-2 type transport system permease protein